MLRAYRIFPFSIAPSAPLKGYKTLQPRTFQPQVSTPGCSTMNFSTPDITTPGPWLVLFFLAKIRMNQICST